MANKCKFHTFETGVGVCATCLRDRLLSLVQSQNEISAAAVAGDRYHYHQNHHRRRCVSGSQPLRQPSQSQEPVPPPLFLFPRSVSPYRCHSSSDYDDARSTSSRHRRRHRCRQLLFYSTPQVGPDSSTGDFETGSSKKKTFSIVKAIFRNSKSSREPELGSLQRKQSWISSLIPRRLNSKKHLRARECRRPSDRGLSPAVSDNGEGSGMESGYSSESSVDGGCRIPGPTPLRRTATANNHNRRATREISGFTLCLSPLVRASPGRHRRSHPADIGFSGDLRGGLFPPAVLGPNRSRKLADLGRFRG